MENAENPDIEERLEIAADALCKSEERAVAGQLALELMHEIRNPLEALTHLTYLAEGQADDPEAVKNYMHLAEEQTALLREIVNQTLGFARSSPMPRPVDLVLIAEAALRIHQQTIASKRVHLVKALPGELIANVYASEILQAISNLILNALDALPVGGTIHLRLRKSKDALHLLIADTGHGIPPEIARAIFQPFFTTKGERGTGLGLALTRRIIDRHKGNIALRSSTRPGKSGTIFKITLPLAS